MRPITSLKLAFDPLLGRLVAEYKTSSHRVRTKLRNPYDWCFCDLCGGSTEYAIAILAKKVFKRLDKGYAKAVPVTDDVRQMAEQEADALAKRYQRALEGNFDSDEPGMMLLEYCNIRELRGDWSVEAFREHVERRALLKYWAKMGELLSAVRLPNQPEGAAKPSKFYCEKHNPRRSEQSRRNYQRDRRFVAEYQDLISLVWSNQAHKLPTWDIEAHAHVRREAFRLLQGMKKTAHLIDELIDSGVANQAEIARRLGVSRQAVNVAIKRGACSGNQKPIA